MRIKPLACDAAWAKHPGQGWCERVEHKNQKDVLTHDTIKTCLSCESENDHCVSVCVSLCWYGCELYRCAAEWPCCDCTSAISTPNCCQQSLVRIQHFPLFACSCHCAAGTHEWVSMFGTELFHCTPAHQCDFSRGQG